MMTAVSRAVVTIAISCLGNHRAEWAHAMEAEFEAASADGQQLSFALGCLLAAFREMPEHEEGRFTIASHLLVFVLLIPTAALLLSAITTGFPFSYLGEINAFGAQPPLLSEGNRSALPSLAILLLVLAGFHLRIAWLVLERDWPRVVALGTLLAVATVTLIIFATIVFAAFAFPFIHAAVLAIQLTCIAALARWHAWSFGGGSEMLI